MKRVCLTGVESTGKSTLAPILAAHFGAALMPEYGRLWAEQNGTAFTPEALRQIASGHIEQRLALESTRPDMIIEDTDIVMTSAWAHMIAGNRDPVLSAIPATADLYLLFADDTPWIDDGTRQFGGSDRRRFAQIVDHEMQARAITPVSITGSWSQRQTAAIASISTFFKL